MVMMRKLSASSFSQAEFLGRGWSRPPCDAPDPRRQRLPEAARLLSGERPGGAGPVGGVGRGRRRAGAGPRQRDPIRAARGVAPGSGQPTRGGAYGPLTHCILRRPESSSSRDLPAVSAVLALLSPPLCAGDAGEEVVEPGGGR